MLPLMLLFIQTVVKLVLWKNSDQSLQSFIKHSLQIIKWFICRRKLVHMDVFIVASGEVAGK